MKRKYLIIIINKDKINIQISAVPFVDNESYGINSNVYASNFVLMIDIRANLNEI